ncbi:MAG: hypothetical protein ACOCQR_02600 [bacterium]
MDDINTAILKKYHELVKEKGILYDKKAREKLYNDIRQVAIKAIEKYNQE